jgi:hypothetical protein
LWKNTGEHSLEEKKYNKINLDMERYESTCSELVCEIDLVHKCRNNKIIMFSNRHIVYIQSIKYPSNLFYDIALAILKIMGFNILTWHKFQVQFAIKSLKACSRELLKKEMALLIFY